MREMKDSGVEWIGDIPKDWYIKKIKYLGDILGGLTYKPCDLVDSGMPVLRATNIQNGLLDLSDLIYLNHKQVSLRFTAQIGDILICSCNGSLNLVGKSAIIDKANTYSFGSFMMVFRSNISKYMYYLLNSNLISYYRGLFATTTINQLTKSNFGNFKVPLPDTYHINKICSFLDKKCLEIDSLTKDIQEEIEVLEKYKRSVISEAVTKGLDPNAPMKDSGIFYMQPVNANWRLTKIGYICVKLNRSFCQTDIALVCSNKGKVIPRPSNVAGVMVSEDHAMQGIHFGDIAIHGMDTWHGAIALSKHKGKITRVVHVCDSSEDNRFIVYYLQHLSFHNVYKLISNGVRENTSDFRSWDKVRKIAIAIPSIKEQQSIADFLDKKCSAIDDTIAKKKEQLEVLADYKKSLIYEYVTGKKEVLAHE